MDQENEDLVDRVHDLSDIELAVLLSLISHGHCVIGTPEDAVQQLVQELALISQGVFGLSCTVADCHSYMTLEEFQTSLLLNAKSFSSAETSRASTSSHHDVKDHFSYGIAAADHYRLSQVAPQVSDSPGVRSPQSGAESRVSAPRIANVVIARNLNLAPEIVQIQALELLRNQRFITTTAMQAAPRPFLLIAVVAAERGFLWNGDDCTAIDVSRPGRAEGIAPHMTAHLNDHFSIGHWHDPDDGFLNIEDRAEDDARSQRVEIISDSDSVVWRVESGDPRLSKADRASAYRNMLPSFSEADIEYLTALGENVHIDMEVLRYQMNIVAFLRLHRAVAILGPSASGFSCVSPNATKHFEKLVRCLAPLHRLDYVTPALVALAARKTYLHRIRTVPVGQKGSRPATVHERSMQWGSEKAAVEALLERISPEDVIDDVLASVAPPV
ncbi:hypothetical protein SEPCBS57363_005813 [Sporothrix epigloea]|uniref:Magnesium chelatase n=1 Tax=Sporothrix epigloea TaxID=1892477 RepID=A0ABP0DZZ5_9PEZI